MTGVVVRRCLASLQALERMKEIGTALHGRNLRCLFLVSQGSPDGLVLTGAWMPSDL